MTEEATSKTDRFLWHGLMLLLFLIPLAFSTSLYRSFEIPKAALLRAGVALIFLGWWLLPDRERFLTLLRSSSVLRAVVLVFVSAGIASAFSIEPSLSIFGTYHRQLGLLSMAALTVFSIILMERTQDDWKLTATLRVLTGAGSLVALYALVQYLGCDPVDWKNVFGNRPSSTVGHPDFLGDLLVMTIPLCLTLIYVVQHWWVKIWWALCGFLQGAALLVSQTRGAWIAAAVTIPLFFALEPLLHRQEAAIFRRRMKISIVALTLLVLTCLALFWAHAGFRQRAATIARVSDQPRVYLWRDTFKVIKKTPLAGSGPETFRLAFMPYKSMELARLEKNINFDNPHNNYLYLWATTGVLGLGAYLYLLFSCLRQGIVRVKKEDNPLVCTVYLGLLTSLAAYSVSMLTGFDTISTLLCLYAVASLFAAAERLGSKESLPENRRWSTTPLFIGFAIIAGLVACDSVRIVRADHRALLGLERAHEGSKAAFDQSRTLLQQATELLPRESFYPLQRGVVSLTAGLQEQDNGQGFRDSIHWAKRSLVHGWAPENSWNLISTSYLNLGKWDKAEEACRKGLALDPHNVPLKYNLAKALIYLGRSEEALQEVEEMLVLDDQFPEARKLRMQLAR